MNNVLSIGDIGIQRIIEIEGPFLPSAQAVAFLLPGQKAGRCIKATPS